MLYTRLNDAGNAFEPERNLMHHSFGLDGGELLPGVLSGARAGEWEASDRERRLLTHLPAAETHGEL